jgi:polysaccharide pyruvyl transferase WcaK-like protein
MLVTVIGKLRRRFPDAGFKVFTYYPKEDRELVTQKHVDILSCKPASLVLRFLPFAVMEWLANRIGLRLPDRCLTRVVQELRKCDVLVDISGVSFVSGREIYLPFNILTIWPALMLGVPVVKLSQALGNFNNPVTRACAKVFLPECRRIFARGQTTEAHLQGLGLDNFERAADTAFLFRPEYSLTAENENKNEAIEIELLDLKKAGKSILAIAPSSLVHNSSQKAGKDYIQAILELVSHFDRNGMHFLFLPNSNREGSEKNRNNDLTVIRALREQARLTMPAYLFERMHWVLWDANTRSLKKLLSYCEMLFTSRFHAMIAALSLGVPVLVMGWSHKYVEALADFGLERYAADFDDTQTDLANLADELYSNREQLRKDILDHLVNVQDLSERQFSYLESLILEK